MHKQQSEVWVKVAITVYPMPRNKFSVKSKLSGVTPYVEGKKTKHKTVKAESRQPPSSIKRQLSLLCVQSKITGKNHA